MKDAIGRRPLFLSEKISYSMTSYGLSMQLMMISTLECLAKLNPH